MATENKSKPNNPNKNTKKRKHYLPHNKPMKKGAYPLRPGVQGFFITCDGGREHQASHEAINVIDSFFEEVVEGIESKVEQSVPSEKPLNKITKFTYSDSSSSDDDDDNDNDDKKNADDHHPRVGDDLLEKEHKDKSVVVTGIDASNESESQSEDDTSLEKKTQRIEEKPVNHFNKEAETVVPPVKRQHTTTDASECGNRSYYKVEKKSVDQLIEAELAELGDRSKRRFSKLDPGCNGVVFVQMNKRDGDPGPKDIIQHMMTSLASTRKHVSRFLLRVLPIEITCYASEEEIRRAIKPLIDKHFPEETQTPLKFAVLYEARANTGIDRTKIIDAVAKSVPPLHKVDLGNPDVNIVVQIVKTLCLMGIVEKYKEFAKYNIRQLTSSTQ